MNQTTEKKDIHFNGLNGIRAICALAVVISHASFSLSMAGIKAGPVFMLASYGVTAFFALSGFLITYLLLAEKETSNAVSAKKFYMRRILRIWPLYFSYMALVLILDYAVFGITDFSSIGYYLFFVPNIPYAYDMVGLTTVAPIFLLGHFWSLGVEEQFYTFYPWLIKWFRKSLNVLLLMLVITICIKALAKLASYKTGNPFWYALADNTRFDAMAIGGLGAWLFKFRLSTVKRIAGMKLLQWLVSVVLILAMINRLLLPNTLAHMLIAVVTVLVIYYAHLFDHPLINLRKKMIDYLGKISFGLYVYHPLAIALTALWLKNTDIEPVTRIILLFSFVILLTVLFAALSYRYIERYFLKLKFNYAVVKSKD